MAENAAIDGDLSELDLDEKSFEKGLYIPHHKEYTNDREIERLPYPERVIIPLNQHIGETVEPVVEPGDRVEKGQLLGELDEFWSAPVHASVSGEVTAIEECPTAGGDIVPSVIIEADEDQEEYEENESRDWQEIDVPELKKLLKKNGIVGMGGAACPTHINVSSEEPVPNLILNGAECEPFLTCDHRMMAEWADKLIEGARILFKIIKAENCYIGIETNKPDAIKVLQEKTADMENFEVIPLDTKYPQGYKKSMIKAITDKEPPMGARSADVGCIVRNVGTTIAIYEAIVEGKPLFERVVTVSGPETVPEAGNYLMPVGTPVRHIMEITGVDIEELSGCKIILGGAMTGSAVGDLDIPVTKSDTGVILLPPDMAHMGPSQEEKPCIRCGKCVESCPMKLYPNELSLAAKAENYEEAESLHATECAECGICSFVCPSNRKVAESIIDAKPFAKEIRRSK